MEIVGHEIERKNLRNLVLLGKVGHAYLFYGKSGIGKKLVAKEFAKSFMCFHHEGGFACRTV